MINDASVVIGGGNWGIKEADVLGYKLINDEYYARDIDFANSTAAGTYTDSTGIVRKAPYNLAQYSEMFTDASWIKTGATIGANTETAPNGTLTADKLIEDTALSTHLVLQLPAGSISGNVYTFSFYAKAAERFNVSAVNNAAGGGQATYNLNTGVVTFTSGISASMQLVGDGWYRCILTYSPTVTGNFNTHIRLANSSGANTYQGDGISGAFIWGAQLVEGTEALPYFPTTTRLNVPRIDYRNADGSLSTVGRLLLEPQRTNLFQFSEQFDNAYWGKNDITVSANVITSPDGYTNADKFVENTGTSQHYLSKNSFAVSATSTYTISIYAKKSERDVLVIRAFTPAFVALGQGTFNLTNATATGTGTSIVSVGNDWYRCILTYTTGADTTNNYRFNLVTASNYAGIAGYGLYAYGAQIELGAYPTTYIPTTTAAVTRNADAASRTGVSSWIGQAEGTLFFECNLKTFSSISALFTLSDGTSTNRLRGRRTAAQTISFERNLSGQTDQSVFLTTVPASGTIKAAFAWSIAANGMAIYINGTGTSLASAVPMFSGQLSVLSLGMLQDATSQLGDGIGQVYLLPTRITNEQLQSLTTL